MAGSNYKLHGWRRQSFDARDWRFHVPNRITNHLSQWVDLQPGMGPYRNQGGLGTCGCFSACELINFDEKVQGLNVSNISELLVYWFTRKLMGSLGQDSGVDNRTLLKALAEFGFCDAKFWPYDEAKYNDTPPLQAQAIAAGHKITNYAAVAQTPGQMQGTIQNGRPFLFGFTCFKQLQSDQATQNGIITMPAAGETPIGGHDMPCLGFTTVDRPGNLPGNIWPAGHYKLRQHWVNDNGSPTGDGGYYYIPYDYAHNTNLAGDFWVINALPGHKIVVNGPRPVAPGYPMAARLDLRFAPHEAGESARGTFVLTPEPTPAGAREVGPVVIEA